MKSLLKESREKTTLLEQEKKKLDDQYKLRTEQIQAKIKTLKVAISKLGSNLATIGQSQMFASPVSITSELEEKMIQ